MEILYGTHNENIKKLITSRAKFQKVMVLYDDYISNLEISQIYEEIKEICVFNQSNIKSVNEVELNNGYRMVIYLCGVDSFLKSKFSRDEFINVFVPKSNAMLPYFLSQNDFVSKNENYIILDAQRVDVGILSSVRCNQFFKYLINLFGMGKYDMSQFLIKQDFSRQSIINAIQQVEEDVEFFDIKIFKKYNLSYDKIVLLDLILIDAFLILIKGIKSQNLQLVDVYKSTKENCVLTDKFYAMFHNDAVFQLIVLNYNCIINYCCKTKEIVLNCLSLFNYTKEDVTAVCKVVKDFAKNDENLFAYLYLFNIFGV